MPKCFQDAERLIGAWNERQAGRICCSRRRSVPLSRLGITSSGSIARPAALRRDIDLRALDRHRDGAVTSLIPLLSCRSCRPNAPFAKLVRLSKTSIADEMRVEHTRRVLGE
jgi:hypothetical protein